LPARSSIGFWPTASREFAQAMAEQPLDFVQFTYNIVDREAERRLLPLAAERGLAVVVNRPFRRKQLF
jgi:aryl-alcohol dehydrogenase-like predicted oxidoreductase